ncbi:quinohemoprotein amine dehydrogenase subunit alpha [Marinobacterium sediminicola]|uniref:Quinohemoprotein amine dehydrogenase n=1 Tax=Marinobacterium sediminicola TaxID=518898 RepID=A0ABY1RYP8_9GAMM|nr:quinohemoprotein amine dehydrogenase subunit alpha [Marinobacterium sediminicola]ULG68066.1 quinohemoprotein amine dehydrogenase subunit alpha [Marinobacterium sediminicola]SMR73424.1 quinohemoprotein amine dehydrogenase [Marinobacterium sediminicola]
MALSNNNSKRAALGTGLLALAGLVSTPVLAQDAQQIIRDRCLACHTETGSAEAPSFSRISEQRKTPEGWLMTINRMTHLRGLELTREEKRALVKHLADTQGLAPEETEGYRYLLEQDTNLVENSIDQGLAETCGRCHSEARFALQRRTEQEWKYLVDFHMGQFPTTELHSLARDRQWYQIASNDTAADLGKRFPLITQEWNNWQKASKSDLMGRWRVTGFVPGKGEFDAWMTAAKTSEGHYDVTLEGLYADGTALNGEGKATVYTGYEWRASLTIDGVKMRQVMAADKQGNSLEGRMFVAAEREIGGELSAVRDQGKAAVVAVQPSYLRAGEPAELTLIGQNLKGDINLGEGVVVEKVLSRADDRITVLAKATGNEGLRTVRVGQAASESALAVYSELARVDVTPANAVTRIGGAGGNLPKVRASYRAVGYSAGADGKPGTEDDLRLGYMPASWSIKPADEVAAHDKDDKYAGSFNAAGIFTPGDAGLNPERKMSANNVGRLTVVATVADGSTQVEGEGSMLVAVQDFVRRVLD